MLIGNYQTGYNWEAETETDTWRLHTGKGARAKPPISRASSLWTPSLCTTYTKPQPPAGLTAGRPETHKNATSLKAALNLTLQSENSSSSSSTVPAGQLGDVTQEVDKLYSSCSAAAFAVGLRDETSHPKKLGSLGLQLHSCHKNNRIEPFARKDS